MKERTSMTQLSTLKDILMDRKKHSREDLLEQLYQTRNGVKSGRLAARVDDLRRMGYEVESPLIRYAKGRKVTVKTKGRKRTDKEFWYLLKGSKTIWKRIEKEWEANQKKRTEKAYKAHKAV